MTFLCPSCRSSIAETAAFCPSCGSKIDPELTVDAEAPGVAPDPVAPDPAPATGKAVDRFETGECVGERYRIVQQLGRGAMGEVYRADDLELGQSVALKFLPQRLANDDEALERLRSEVRLARGVSHANVCRVYDLNRVDGHAFLTMEYIDGEDLSGVLRRLGRPSREKAEELARQICSGLAAAHEVGVLHRDLKPANIMIDGRGRARITDFGIAALTEDLEGTTELAGTPAYMAPEQLADARYSVQSDIYSLGLVLHEVFTGRPVFETDSLQELRALHDSGSTTSFDSTHVDPVIERAIRRCLEAEPDSRPGSVYEVLRSLPGGDPLAAAIAAGETPSPQMVAAAEGAGSLPPWVAATCLAVVLGGLVVVTVLSKHTTRVNRQPLDSPGAAPAALATKAREIVRGLGYDSPPRDSAFGYGRDVDYVRYVQESDKSSDRWDRLAAGQPAVLHFWYRQSPSPLLPRRLIDPGGYQRVSLLDPPPMQSGMVSVELDLKGQLIGLHSVPPQSLPEPSDGVTGQAETPAATFDFSRLFELAGFDPDQLQSTEPQWTAPVMADEHRAWTGMFPDAPDTAVRIEAAAFRGRPVYFDLVGEWTRPSREEATQGVAGLATRNRIGVALMITLMVAAVCLAPRNLRQGRADRRGAFRLAAYALTASMGIWLCCASHVAAIEEYGQFTLGAAFALWTAALLWVFYIALEPYMRRLWPDSLVSWSRLLSGRLRDPLVGRDLLLGATVAVLVQILRQMNVIVPSWLGLEEALPLFSGDLDSVLGTKHSVAALLQASLYSLNIGLIGFLMLMLLRVGLRRQWLAAGAFVAFCTMLYSFGSGHPYVSWLFLGAAFTIQVTFVTRYGLFLYVSYAFAIRLLTSFPITPDFSVWYAGTGLFAIGVVAVMAAYGFWTCLAGRRLFPSDIFPETT